LQNSNADYKIYDIKLDEKLIGTIEFDENRSRREEGPTSGVLTMPKRAKATEQEAKKVIYRSVFDGTAITKLV